MRTEFCRSASLFQKPQFSRFWLANFQQHTSVFENFLSTTEKLRISFSFADEQFQANRRLGVAFETAVQRQKIWENDTIFAVKIVFAVSYAPARPRMGVRGASETPALLVLLAPKSTTSSIGSDWNFVLFKERIPHFCYKKHFFSKKYTKTLDFSTFLVL